ncbi:MAG: hypothetical protein OHK93_005257, partial [Ramalina farinacea]|nr:hypothetical protein [Ramalina farinacea]
RGYASDNEGSEYASDDEKIEQDKSDEEEAGQLHSSIPLPYWRIYRENTEYFAAPKDQQGKIRPAGEHNDTVWVDDPSTGDTFLALGWLIAKASCGRKRITRYVCALNLSTDPVSMWLIYDYRQPDFYEYLRLGEVPTIPDENYYLDYPNACDLAGCKHPGDSTGRTEQKKEEKTGFMDQPKPWDIACLYLDADKEWPENLDAIAATAPDADVDYQAPAPLLVYGDAKPNLRAEGAEPPPSLLASFPHSS